MGYIRPNVSDTLRIYNDLRETPDPDSDFFQCNYRVIRPALRRLDLLRCAPHSSLRIKSASTFFTKLLELQACAELDLTPGERCRDRSKGRGVDRIHRNAEIRVIQCIEEFRPHLEAPGLSPSPREPLCQREINVSHTRGAENVAPRAAVCRG